MVGSATGGGTMVRRLAALTFLAIGLSSTSSARNWRWIPTPTEQSSKELVATLDELQSATLGNRAGVPVKDVVVEAQGFRLHLVSGTVWTEPDVRGAPGGAWFSGEATVSFRPEAARARLTLELRAGQTALEQVPVKHAYVRRFGGAALPEIVPATEAFVALADEAAYADAKAALRQSGLEHLQWHLNRAGRSAGTLEVVFPVEAWRIPGAEESWARYVWDPGSRYAAALQVFAHGQLSDHPTWKYFWRPVAEEKARSAAFAPEAGVLEYGVKVDVSAKTEGVEQLATLSIVPAPGVRSLLLDFTTELEVQSVTDAGGAALPWFQWDENGTANPDPSLLVVLPESPAGSETKVLVKSKGSLFESYYGWFYMKEEDNWLPRIREAAPAVYDLVATIPRKFSIVGGGVLQSVKEEGENKVCRFRTPRPAAFSSFHFGEMTAATAQADGVTVEAYANDASLRESKFRETTAVETANAVKIYTKIFQPLDLPSLRVAATPTSHGRGFQGIILIGSASHDSSSAETYRAHEVAHQWWGNVVMPEDWRENRWIGESFAEYSSMEFYQVRYGDRKKTVDHVDRTWLQPLLDLSPDKWKRLDGTEVRNQCSTCYPLVLGTQNVYTRGPMVLQMLRHYIKVRTGSDALFWDILNTFMREKAYQTATTDDFVALVDRKLATRMDWFWKQWLYRGDTPVVRWSWTAVPQGGQTLLKVTARQEATDFRLFIPVRVTLADGQQGEVELEMLGRNGELSVPLPGAPKKVELNAERDCLVKLVQEGT